MEELNKTQLILLAILLSFITSIATGIVTVTLLDQAPPAVTQTINRIVKETVKEIVPGKPVREPSPQTIIVKEEDFIIEATKKTIPNIVEVGHFKKKSGFKITAETDIPEVEFLGTGFAASGDGIIVTTRFLFSPDRQLFVKTSNGMYYELLPLSQSEDTGLAFGKVGAQLDALGKRIAVSTSTAPLFPKASFANSDALEVGQTALALANRNGVQLLLGVVSRIESVEIPKEGERANETVKKNSIIYTTIGYDEKFAGGPLVKSDGQVMGINLIASTGERYTIPSNILQTFLLQLKEGKGTSEGDTNPLHQTARAIDTQQN